MSAYWNSSVSEWLRDPAREEHRSAYAIEINPWVRRGDLEAALLFRGAIISALAYLETRLGELSIRLSRLPECEAIRENFPFTAERRIAFLRSAFSTTPLCRFEAIAGSFLNRFEDRLRLRHLVAHAHMESITGQGIIFHDFPSTAKDGSITKRREHFTLPEFERLACEVCSLGRLGQRLLLKLERSGMVPDE